MIKPWTRIGWACCLALLIGMVASPAAAGTAAEGSSAVLASSSAAPAAYDEFVFAAEVTSIVQVGCNFCGVIDACLDKHPNEQCLIFQGHICRCKKCNGINLECYW